MTDFRRVPAWFPLGLAGLVAAACATRPIDVPAREDAPSGASGASGATAGKGTPPIPTTTETSRPPTPPPDLVCHGTDEAFVRRAIEAVLGRRAHSTREARVYEALLAQAENAKAGSGRRVVVEALTHDPGYVRRWTDVYRDALLVQRAGPLANPSCYGVPPDADSVAMATFVRDNASTARIETKGFTMADVIDGALRLDDVSPIYLGNLFPMIARTFTGANAAAASLERARRADFGGRFDAAYLRRDGVCLRCHNSESSVTFRDDPATNRHFALPGRFEQAIFGASTGAPDDETHDGVQRMRAVLRYDGVVNGDATPWGFASACGLFVPEEKMKEDFTGVDGKFAGLTGTRVSVWGLERSLRRGFSRLRAHGLTRGPNGLVPDSDEAFAYLVSVNIVERIWEEIIGTRLTIATSFPRNQASENQLLSLTEAFIASGFSHRALLTRIALSPGFDPPAIDDACLPTPYALPAVYDPWITDEPAERRGNGPGDAVSPRSSRTLLRATYDALEWPLPGGSDFTEYEQPFGRFQAEIGVPLRSTIPGFRGLDFGARLSWEQQVGACVNPSKSPDFVDRTLSLAATVPNATVRDVLETIKDRLTGEPTLGAKEGELAAALIEAPLGAPIPSLSEGQRAGVRRFCGVLLSSPQMLLVGLAPLPVTNAPRLTLPSYDGTTTCAALAARPPAGFAVSCAADQPTVTLAP